MVCCSGPAVQVGLVNELVPDAAGLEAAAGRLAGEMLQCTAKVGAVPFGAPCGYSTSGLCQIMRHN